MRTSRLARGFALLAPLLLFSGPAARAQTEAWVPAAPSRVVPRQVSVFNCDGQVGVNARWVFNDGGYRVVQTPLVSRAGQTVTLDARVEEWTGGRTLALVPFEKNFDLGALEPGTYTLDFKSWGTTLKQLQFTVIQTPPAAQPADQTCFFVSQHYRDFLSREPDGSGLAFWTDGLNRCGLDAQCREAERVNVSAAFFLSIEFKETGYFVYRVYRAALGRAPAFAEFVPEAAAVGQRVVVGSNDPWQIRLDGNKNSFVNGFVNRQEFLARYNGLSNEQYVDKLFETAGFTPAPSERDELLNGLNNCAFTIGCPTRADALRKVAENPALDRKVFNEAFVTMQYFGYLRRDPDAEGFQFWLAKLNRFGGNFVDAEMVRAFISSDEYRSRFGQP
jgi:hypothetical protein